MANRLARSTSPYLPQHADNPVDWQEWSPEAFEEARRRDVPVLLSVGYAACHWCHVMAHESFEDDGVAAVVNRGFVAVKVDREERPDIDAVYMTATTALTGHGGWPMTCFLTPAGEPFYCGTYFPRDHFLQLLEAVGRAWADQREDVLRTGGSIAARLNEVGAAPPPLPVDEPVLASAVAGLFGQFDEARGGFGGAPKFPPSMVLEFLLRHHGRTGSTDALLMAEGTCEAMARGGMYDQLGGGFARYSVDADWVVPHFEKMLYDNAQLLRVYAHLHRATGSPLARRVALETAEFMLRDLGTPEGGFASALDADTDGVEGLTYVWTPAQLSEVLGPDDGARAADLLGVTTAGTFEHGASTLQLRQIPTTRSGGRRSANGCSTPAATDPSRRATTRSSPRGTASPSPASATPPSSSREPSLLEAAVTCADVVLRTHLVDGRLRRASRAGAVGAAATVLDDHGNLAEGLLALHQATGDPRWLEVAHEILDVALAHFAADGGGFHDTADDAEELFTRPRSQGDNAEPSGQSALAGALRRTAALTGSGDHRAAADAALAASGVVAAREPRFGGWVLAVAEAAAAGPLQVAIARGETKESRHDPCWTRRGTRALPGSSSRTAPRARPAYRCWRRPAARGRQADGLRVPGVRVRRARDRRRGAPGRPRVTARLLSVFLLGSTPRHGCAGLLGAAARGSYAATRSATSLRDHLRRDARAVDEVVDELVVGVLVGLAQTAGDHPEVGGGRRTRGHVGGFGAGEGDHRVSLELADEVQRLVAARPDGVLPLVEEGAEVEVRPGLAVHLLGGDVGELALADEVGAAERPPGTSGVVEGDAAAPVGECQPKKTLPGRTNAASADGSVVSRAPG